MTIPMFLEKICKSSMKIRCFLTFLPAVTPMDDSAKGGSKLAWKLFTVIYLVTHFLTFLPAVTPMEDSAKGGSKLAWKLFTVIYLVTHET